MELVAQRRPAVVCIVALPMGGLAHTRHLCKRLKQHLPDQRIIIARWAGQEERQNDGDLQQHADYVGVTLEETLQQLAELAQVLRPPQTTATSDDGSRQTTPHSRRPSYVGT